MEQASKAAAQARTMHFRSEQCVVYGNGDIDVLHPNGYVYEIDADTLKSNDWTAHMREKNWVDAQEFENAYAAALRAKFIHDNGKDKTPAERPRPLYARP